VVAVLSYLFSVIVGGILTLDEVGELLLNEWMNDEEASKHTIRFRNRKRKRTPGIRQGSKPAMRFSDFFNVYQQQQQETMSFYSSSITNSQRH